LTGGIATGKSLVADAFAARGARVLSADAIARDLTANGRPLVSEILGAFGEDVRAPDGSLDRAMLARCIFSDETARKRLENLVHPPVLMRIRAEIEAFRNRSEGSRVLVVEIPLLYEVGIEDWFDRIVVVAAEESVQVRRLQDRDGLQEAEARRRIAVQWPLAEKADRADFVIWNSGRPEDVEWQVDRALGAI